MWPVCSRGAWGSAGVTLALALTVLSPAWSDVPAAATASDPFVTNDIHAYLEDDGTLHVQEEIRFDTTPPDEFVRTFIVREQYDDDHDRRYDVSRFRATDGSGGEVPLDVIEKNAVATVHLDTRDTTAVLLSYQVRGAVDDLGDRVDLDWTVIGGYNVPVAQTEVVVEGEQPPDGLLCVAGDFRSSTLCTATSMAGQGYTDARFTQANLGVGDRLRIRVNYPAGSVAADVILERSFSITSAFAITWGTAGIFGLVLVILVGGLLLLVHVRGRDERAARAESEAGDHAPLLGWGEHVRFHPPDGVLPGQIGTLIDEQVDVVDITASLVDLAVRGYYRIEELSPRESHEHHATVDWRLRRSPVLPGGDDLRDYERELLHALFDRSDEVLVSELGEDFAQRLVQVRDKLYQDMVDLGWFARRPNAVRNSWTTAGIALTVGGVALTTVLAMFTHLAFSGLAVIIAGAAVTVGAHYMPAKTALGSTVFAHTLGFSRYVKRGDARDVPETGERIQLFSRYLPYAIIFDRVESWANLLADELANEDLPWFDAPETWGREDFAASIKAFSLTLSGLLSSTRPFRTMV